MVQPGYRPCHPLLKQIAAVKVGDKVEVKWVFNERKRVVELKVIAE
jgi:hypothetical protein